VTRRTTALAVAAIAIVPRLAVLIHERADIVNAFTEKSDRFAETLIHTGTFGYVPGQPSAYTQPLYAWFLVPVYWIFGRSWESVGLVQIGVAALTAVLVLQIGRRFLSERTAFLGAALATLNPYLIWHDVHVNREIVDQLVGAAIVLTTLVAAERRSWRLAAVDGVLCGAAILGNTRLTFLPVLVAAYLAWRVRAVVPVLLVLFLAGVTVTPWLVRNEVSVGCWTLTTDSRALWKANNPNTYRTLAAGKWIDAVPPLPGAPPSPEEAANIYERTGRVVHLDECAQLDLYQHQVIEFWKHHPGEKAKLADQAVGMLWDPRASETTNRPGEGTHLDTLRRLVEGVYMSVLYALAIVGAFVLPRAVSVFVLLLLAYNTLAAALFAGTTRYRVPWDFLIAIAAAAGVSWLVSLRRRRVA
jgi:4-amino-4-deoxy-L-arabinose transferase-like glycosyltransferase